MIPDEHWPGEVAPSHGAGEKPGESYKSEKLRFPPLVRNVSSPEGFLGEAASAHEMAQRWLWSHGQPAPTGTNRQSEALFMPAFTVLCPIVCEHTHTHTHDFTLKQTFNKG